MGLREVGNPPHSLLPPPRPPDPSQFKSKILAHKEEITERFNKLSQSMTAFATEQERFRCELREELRQLRLSYSNPSTTTVSTSPSSLITGNPSSPNYCQLPEPPPIPNCKPQPQIPDPTPPASFPLTQAVTNPTYAHIVTATTPPQTSPSKLGALDVCKDENHDVSCLPNIATSTIQNSVPSTPFNSADATLGRHLARRFDQIGVTDVFSVPDDCNLTLLDHLIAEPGLTNIGCCNELNAGYAADGYRSSRTVGACVGGLKVLNAIAGAYNENLPVICIVGGPNSNDYKTNIIRHNTIGLPDFRQELRCFQNVTCFQVVVNNLEDAHELIDRAISISLKESKLVYISIGCYLAGIPHPTFSLEHVPFSLSPKLSDKMGLEAAVEVAAEFLNKAGKPVMVGEPKQRVALAGDVVVELADASGFTLAVMPSAKGMVPKHHPHFIGTYWGAVSTAFYAEFVESADAYLFAWPIFNDYNSVGYSLLLKKEKAIIVQPDSVTIRNGPTFGCVLIKDFRGGLAKRLKHNNATHENCHRIFVPDGHPLKAAPKEPLRVNVMFQHIQMMLSAETAVIAETGDSWFNCQKLKLPPGCGYEFQMQYGSIGWSIGATLGYTKAVPEKQVISFISDGSFQVTTQDVSTMIRMGQRTIIFLINNGGYTIEVEIHDGPYNVIKNWNYTVLVDAIHNERPFINKLVRKMEGAYFAAKFSLVELLAIFISTQKTTLKQIHPLGLNTDVDLIIFPPANFNLFVYEANINLDLDVVMHALSSSRKYKETRSSYYRNNGDKGMLLYKSFNQDETVLLRWMFASSGLEASIYYSLANGALFAVFANILQEIAKAVVVGQIGVRNALLWNKVLTGETLIKSFSVHNFSSEEVNCEMINYSLQLGINSCGVTDNCSFKEPKMDNFYELILDDPYNLIGQHGRMFLWGISTSVKPDLKLLFRVTKNFKTVGNILYNVLYEVLGITMINANSFNKAREIIMVMSTAVHEVVCQLQDRDLLLALLKQNLHKAQERMKLFYDKRHRERTFQIGDWVYLLLQSYKQQAVEKRKVNKLSAKYYGHFEVIERMGTVAYKFKHSASARIHPAKVIDIMLEKGKGQALVIWLIQWIGAPVESATREFAQGMQILNVEVEVLQLKLEDKLFFKVGRVVRDQNY